MLRDASGSYEYVGDELKVFQHAVRWKRYCRDRVQRFVRGRVLEAGGGIGATTRALCLDAVTEWCSVEPDPGLAAEMQRRFAAEPLPVPLRIVTGTLSALDAEPVFDTILYMDVLEHIEDDAAELIRARDRLRRGGHLVVLSPAHQWLFTAFDRAIGHYRRYNRKSLRAAAPAGLPEVRMEYLDAAGLLASLANRLILHSASPTLAQIRFWDGRLVPVSRKLDPVFGRNLGKSILGVWRQA
ncbi:MAG TPA: class I SAM-dependent methyltransferase [Verrucomicrobiales bacterium]|nr:class I SAM-dependent methyltransferase [Verrucomicrobiales bacterium]